MITNLLKLTGFGIYKKVNRWWVGLLSAAALSVSAWRVVGLAGALVGGWALLAGGGGWLSSLAGVGARGLAGILALSSWLLLLDALLLAGLFALWGTLGGLGNRGLEDDLDDLSWSLGGGWVVHWSDGLGNAGVVTGWLASWGTVGRCLVVVWIVHLSVLVGVVDNLLSSLGSLLADIRALGVAGRVALVGWLLLLDTRRLALLLALWLALGLSLLDLELDLDDLWGLGGGGWGVTGDVALLLALWLALGHWLLLLDTGGLALLLAHWLALLVLDDWSLGGGSGGGSRVVHRGALGLALLLALWLALRDRWARLTLLGAALLASWSTLGGLNLELKCYLKNETKLGYLDSLGLLWLSARAGWRLLLNRGRLARARLGLLDLLARALTLHRLGTSTLSLFTDHTALNIATFIEWI